MADGADKEGGALLVEMYRLKSATIYAIVVSWRNVVSIRKAGRSETPQYWQAIESLDSAIRLAEEINGQYPYEPDGKET